MENREKHCTFAKLNRSGRCIADCHENRDRDFKTDCTGATGKTFDYEGAHEVKIAAGFIDGSKAEIVDGKIVAPKPASPVLPETESLPGYKSYGWGTYVQDDGKIFQFYFDPDTGKKLRRYLKS